MLLSEALESFDLSRAGVAPPAPRRWYGGAGKSLLRFLGDVDISQITIVDLRRWRKALVERPARYSEHPSRPEETGGLSAWSVHTYVRGVRGLFAWFTDEGLLESNPAARLELPQLPDEPPKAISAEDLEKLLEVAQARGARDYALICCLGDTGCRVSGLAGLKLDDLDLDTGRAVVREKGKGGNRKARTVYFKTRTIAAVKRWLSVRPLDKGDAVFVGLRGPLTASGIYQILKRLAKAAGVKGRWNPHSFRHGWARGALSNGADISDVSKYLGHQGVDVTVRFYGRWADEELKERHARVSWLPDG